MRYFLAFIRYPRTNDVHIKFYYEADMEDVAARYDPSTYLCLTIIDITTSTIEEMEEYCERYTMCVLR